jgi:hypothetical protein
VHNVLILLSFLAIIFSPCLAALLANTRRSGRDSHNDVGSENLASSRRSRAVPTRYGHEDFPPMRLRSSYMAVQAWREDSVRTVQTGYEQRHPQQWA